MEDRKVEIWFKDIDPDTGNISQEKRERKMSLENGNLG